MRKKLFMVIGVIAAIFGVFCLIDGPKAGGITKHLVSDMGLFFFLASMILETIAFTKEDK